MYLYIITLTAWVIISNNYEQTIVPYYKFLLIIIGKFYSFYRRGGKQSDKSAAKYAA